MQLQNVAHMVHEFSRSLCFSHPWSTAQRSIGVLIKNAALVNRYTATSGICTAYGISARSYAEAQAILARTSIPPNFIFQHLLCLIFTLHVQCFSHPFPFPGDNSLRELYLDLFFL